MWSSFTQTHRKKTKSFLGGIYLIFRLRKLLCFSRSVLDASLIANGASSIYAYVWRWAVLSTLSPQGKQTSWDLWLLSSAKKIDTSWEKIGDLFSYKRGDRHCKWDSPIGGLLAVNAPQLNIESISKNSQNSYYPRYIFTPKTDISKKSFVFTILCDLTAIFEWATDLRRAIGLSDSGRQSTTGLAQVSSRGGCTRPDANTRGTKD